MANTKKLIVPIVALLLCAIALVSAGYAYSGITNSRTGEKDLDSNYVLVDEVAAFSFGTTEIYVDLDNEKAVNGTRTYTFNSTQSDEKVNATSATVATVTVEIGKIKITAGDSAAKGSIIGEVSDDFSSNSLISSVAISFSTNSFDLEANGTSEEITVTATVTLSNAGINDDNRDSLKIPAFTVKITAATA